MVGTSSDYVHPELLVESTWLAEHLDDANVRIIDCDSIERYRRAHIPGAVGLPVHHFLKTQFRVHKTNILHCFGMKFTKIT